MKDPIHLGREIVMVVDDDEETLAALGELLEEAGYLVATAPNGKVALDRLSNQPLPSAFLVDLMMPEMNGWDFVAEIRALPQFRSVPVLVLTAGGSDLLGKAPVAAGYFAKPIGVDDLLRTLRRCLTVRPPRPIRRSGTLPSPVAPPPLRQVSIEDADEDDPADSRSRSA